MQIWGAGLSGLIAACAWPHAEVFEAQSRESLQTHKALLRFRSTAVAELTGVEFRKVRVNKGIWHEGAFVQPSILLANMYSKKVTGNLSDRSIWNLDAVDRYVAPDDFIEQLLNRHAGRIRWGEPGSFAKLDALQPVVSTIPLGKLIESVAAVHGQTAPQYWPDFPPMVRKPITVQRWKVPGADVFQTVYFPGSDARLYRASMTGDTLIAESIGEDQYGLNTAFIGLPFGIDHKEMIPLGSVKQSYGKILPIDNTFRSNFILQASMNYNVFSLGRFATWRNILLDDVVKDIAVIRRLINTSHYELARSATKVK